MCALWFHKLQQKQNLWWGGDNISTNHLDIYRKTMTYSSMPNLSFSNEVASLFLNTIYMYYSIFGDGFGHYCHWGGMIDCSLYSDLPILSSRNGGILNES
uniref:Uncharacterized protein n=1 Tax=Micrurus lemniscatus lemniscatus TaxID=129467 RepID=A0A2D4HB91_MICLE